MAAVQTGMSSSGLGLLAEDTGAQFLIRGRNGYYELLFVHGPMTRYYFKPVLADGELFVAGIASRVLLVSQSQLFVTSSASSSVALQFVTTAIHCP